MEKSNKINTPALMEKNQTLKTIVYTKKSGLENYVGRYRFAFNGQEKDDEVSGSGNTMTAEFWEYDSRLGRRWNVDPVMKHHLSSYQTFDNSPILKIDPNGDNDGEYLNEKGDKIADDGKRDGKVYAVNTSKTTDQMYGKDDFNEKGKSNPIKPSDAQNTEEKLKNGSFTGQHMKNVTFIGTKETLKGMIDEVSRDNGKGGTNPNNNREYGGALWGSFVSPTKPGEVVDPSKVKEITINAKDFHSHPSGDNKGYQYAQPPSKTDIDNSRGTDYVFGMRKNQTIYIYNSSGVISTVPLNAVRNVLKH